MIKKHITILIFSFFVSFASTHCAIDDTEVTKNEKIVYTFEKIKTIGKPTGRFLLQTTFLWTKRTSAIFGSLAFFDTLIASIREDYDIFENKLQVIVILTLFYTLSSKLLELF